MKLIFSALFLISMLFISTQAVAATKVAQKVRVLEERIISAESCSIAGESVNAFYGVGYQYTVTMKVTLKQKVESYSVQVQKNIFGKISELEMKNSTKSAPERNVPSTQSIKTVVRYPDSETEKMLLKGCEDERQFINTGSYPPPPPKPVVVEKPKKPVTTTPPVTPIVPPVDSTTVPVIPGLPGLPDLPGGETPADSPLVPLFPIDVP